MAFDDSLIGSDDFDPRTATEDLIRQQSAEPLPETLDPRMLNTRLARKLGQPPPRQRPTKIERPEQLDLGDFAPADATAAPKPAGELNLGDFAPVEATAAPKPTSASVGTYAKEFGKGVAAGAKDLFGTALKGAAGVYELGAPAGGETPQVDPMGNPTGFMDPATAEIPKKPITERTLYKAGEAIEHAGKEALAPGPGFENSWTRAFGQGAGSMLAGIPIAMIPGAGPLVGGAIWTMAGSGEAVDNAVKGKATTEQTELAALWGAPAGATDLLDTILPRLGSTGRALGFIKRVGLSAIKGALLEGGQEGVQQLMQNAIAKGIYKPDQDMFEDVARSVAVAAILGGAVGGASGALHRDSATATTPPGPPGGPPPPTAGALPGTGPSAPPPGGTAGPSSPEDIAAFNERARQSNPNPPPNNGPSRPVDPATMDDAELSAAFQQARADMGDISLEQILAAGGYSSSTIGHLKKVNDGRAAVEEAIGIARAYANEKAQKAGQTGQGPDMSGTSGPQQEGLKPQGPVPHADYATLREYGYSDEDIGNMSAAQRTREVADAKADGIDPAAAMKKHAQPAQRTTPTGAPVDRKGAAGTRADPITATSADDVRSAQPVEPKSEAQAQAENYQHAHMELPQFGLTGSRSISIETGLGQERKGTGPDGKPWSVKMTHAAYGRIKGSKGADGQPLDVFVGPHPTSPHVFIIDQHEPGKGFDEHKIMLGFRNPIEAMHAYANSYNDGANGRIGGATAMSAAEFQNWLNGDTTKPLSKTPTTPAVSNGGAAARTLTEAEIGADTSVPKVSPADGATEATAGVSAEIIANPEKSSAPSPTQEPHNVVSEPTAEHHDQIETALGPDAGKVAVVDIARAAEIMAENDGMTPETAFGQAVIENAVEQGFITEQQAEAAYGEEVKDVLDAGRESASGGSENPVGERAASDEGTTGGAAETGVIPGGGEAGGKGETGKPADTGGERQPVRGTTTETTEQPAAEVRAAENEPAAKDAHYSYRIDNPGGDWLKRKQEDALADERNHKTKGATTAWVRPKDKEGAGNVSLPTSLLAKVPGMRGEVRGPGDPQFDDLLAKVKKEGWNNDSAILVKVNHLGEPVIPEGNTRVAVAKAIGQKTVPVWVDWQNGAEQTKGPWSPENILPQITKAEVTKAKAKPTVEPVTEQEEKTKIEDAGEKIGGARKDEWIGRGLTFDDLEGMTEIERTKNLTKHNIWQKPDYVQAVADGVDPVAVALIKRLYDRLPVKPNEDRYRGSDNPAKDFIFALNTIRDIVKDVKTLEDAKDISDRADIKLPWGKRGIIYPAKGRTDPLRFDHADIAAAKRAVEAGFPEMAPWQRLFAVTERTRWPTTPDKKAFTDYFEAAAKLFEKENTSLDLRSGGINHAGFITLREWKGTKEVEPDSLSKGLQETYVRLLELRDQASMGKEWTVWRKNGGRIGEGHATREDAETAAKAAYDALGEERKNGAEEPKRPHLDQVTREGPDYRKGRDVTGDDFVKDFGFRGVEFGNYVAGDERQKVVNLAYDALHDLARAMNLPAKAISLNGTLAVGFGSRGRGGRAAAHYEPGRIVINMTKVNGAGSLAHEFGHALDHYLSTLSPGGKIGISGWDTTPAGPGTHWSGSNFLATNSRLPVKLRAAVNRLMHDMFNVEEDDAGYDARINREIESAKSGQESWIKRARELRERKAKGGSSAGLQQAETQIQVWGKSIERLEKQRADGRKKQLPSNYLKEATKLSGETGDYWRRPNEMFARAFESFIHDKIKDEGFESQYLVQGVEPNRFGNGFKGNPYPAGDERATINTDFARVMRALTVGEGKLGAGTRLEGALGEPEPVETIVKVKNPTPQPSGESEAEAVSPATLAGAFQQYFGGDHGFAGILEARKFAKERGFADDPKAIEEAIELAIVKTARGEVEKGNTPQVTFERLVMLYGRQPRLGTRTSTSIRDQAYSTPVPLAYVAARLAGITKETTVFEPTAGNGALLITADPNKTIVNELNPERRKNLEDQGFLTYDKDAADFDWKKEWAGMPNKDVRGGADVVIANPPFGALKINGESKVFDLRAIQPGYETKEIDHVIALRSLEAMKDDGRAVLILGGVNKLVSTPEGRADGYQGKAKREFFKALFDRYNVTDMFTVAGELYERQGAGWPVDVVVINGRGKSALPLPAVTAPRIYKTWDELGGLANGQPGTGSVRPAGEPAGVTSGEGAGVEGSGGRDRGRSGSGQSGVGESGGVRRKPETPVTGPRETGSQERGQSEAGGAVEQPGQSGHEPAAVDFDAAFENALDAAYGKPEAPKVPKPPKVGGERTTPEVAKSAAENILKASDEAFSALYDMFGGPKVSAFFTFDEQTYEKAKPHFKAAADRFGEFKNDLQELLNRMVAHLRDVMKFTREAMAKIAPYLKRFIEDMQAAPEAEAPRKEALKSTATETENQVTYNPRSKVKGLDTLAPVNMAKPMADSLAKLESRVGQIDTFVMKELGYTPQELEKYFGAEQVDALGLAIDNIKNGAGFIIGDQTGIGKGRVNAAIIRWAIRNNRVPVFVTEKPNLYADMFRDLAAVGVPDMLKDKPRILATNADLAMDLEEGNGAKIDTDPSSKAHDKHMMAVLDDLKQHYDMVFTTYNQMQTIGGEETGRRNFLNRLADKPGGVVMIFDESHNAGGQKAARQKKGAPPGRSQFSRELIKKANGVFYSSATYAKRPDVMDLYAATNMAMAVDNISDLAEAIARGRIPMQQAVASMLAKDGQYVRRERSFDGINYNTPKVEVDRENYDNIAAGLAAINELSAFVSGATTKIDAQVRAEGKAVGYDGSVGPAGASSTNFTAIMHNVVNQMLLAMKADTSAKMAIEAIQRGEKPVLTVANTMEAFLKDYADNLGLKPGDDMPGDFGHVLRKYLDRTRTILIKKPFKEKGDKPERHYLTDDELGPAGVAAYNRAMATIDAMDLRGLPLSPIDYIKGKISKAGYEIGEITGRTLAVDYSGNMPKFGKRPGSEKSIPGRIAAIKRFNTRPKKGGIHALIINQAGSTGLSAHASVDFDDQSKRTMFIVQPEGNIDTHMQLLGRINRTGQVVLPEYHQIVANIPAEVRPAAVLSKKMASLNANTTASRSSAVTSKEVTDFMNEYGDQVAAAWIRDNMDLHFQLGEPISISEETGKVVEEDAMRKLTGRLPLFPLAMQERVLGELTGGYDDLIAQLEAAGESALEAKSLDLKARLVEHMEVQGKRNDSGSAFAAPVIMQKVSIARTGKPFKPHEIMTKVAQALDPEIGETSDKTPTDMLAKLLSEYNNPYGILGKKVIERESTERVAALKRFNDYTRPILDAEESAEDRTKQMVKFNETKDRFTTVHQMVPIGRRVVIKTATNNLTGIVLHVEQHGEPKNPLALGSWKATFAIADASRQMTIPFSRMFENGGANENSDLDVEIEPMNDWYETYEATLEKYQHMQSEAREDRYIAGGNILAAFDWLDRKGQIINYTSYRGTVHQGILTARGFDPFKQAIAHGTVEKDPAKIKKFLDDTVEKLTAKDGNVAIQKDGRYGSDYVITAQKSKSKGGKYFLDQKLEALTTVFASKGGNMVAYVTATKLPAAIVRMQELGAEFRLAAGRPEVKKVTPKPDDEEPGPDEPVLAKVQTTATGGMILSPQDRAVIEKAVRDAVHRMVGHHVRVEVFDEPMPMPDSARAAWGDAGAADTALGLYMPWRKLIQIALTPDVIKNLSHEAYHAIEMQLQTPKEYALMQRETPRLRAMLRKNPSRYDLSPEEIDAIDDEEVRAIAFETYADGRAEGLHSEVKRWYQKLLDMLRRLGNALRGLGFKTYEDIFGKAYDGGYRDAVDVSPAVETEPTFAAIRPGGARGGPPRMSETIAEHLRDRGHDRLAGASQKLGIGKLNATEARVLVQDKFARVKNVERSVGGVPSQLSAYQAESLYYGRTGERLERIEHDRFDPLIAQMHARDISPGELNEYLYARHARERNAYIDTINPRLGGEGSGMSDADADAVLAAVAASGKQADYDAVERLVRQIIDETRDNLVAYGLISQDTADAWANQYRNYAPLRGFEEGTEDEEFIGRGRGYDTRGREVKPAFGRASTADGPLHYILMQAEQAIVRGEKNRVGNTFLRFVRAYPDADRWQVNAPTLKRRIDPRTGLVTYYADFNYHNEKDAFVTKVGGKPVVIRLYGKDGMNVARAFKNMGTSNLNGVVRLLHSLTTFTARLSTQWNPNFTLPNLARDVGEALINMQEQDRAHFTRQFAKHLFPAMRGSYLALTHQTTTNRYAAAFREYDRAGGRVHFFGLKDPDDIKANIAAKMRRMEGGLKNSAMNAGAAAADAFDIVNGTIENATRLAAYMAARDVGMTAPDSAMLARNLTVDFNKRGEWGQYINAAYMFGNASIQGGMRATKALGNKHVRRAAYGLVALGAMGALYNLLAGGDDDDGEAYYAKIKPYIRDKNLIIMWPKGLGHDGQYVKIPLPYGFSPFHVIGDRVTALAMGHDKIGNVASSILTSIADAVNPLGEESSPWMMAVPSLLRPGLHIAFNKNWTGNPLYPEHDYDKTRPNSEKSFKSNSDFSKWAAKGLNSVTGGSPYKSGWADWHPGSIDHVLETITGGLGKFVMDVVKTGGAVIKGESFDETKAPIIRRFLGNATDAQSTGSAYYESREEARKAGGENLRAARKDARTGNSENKAAADSFIAESNGATAATSIFKRADANAKRVRERTDLSDEQKREQISAIQKSARGEYRKLKEGPSP